MNMQREFKVLDERRRNEQFSPEALLAIEVDEDALPSFTSTRGPTEHRFAADNQLTVLAIGFLAALGAVLALAGVEQALSTAIETEWIDEPPGLEAYDVFD